jgi:hypothetical protein
MAIDERRRAQELLRALEGAIGLAGRGGGHRRHEKKRERDKDERER